MSSLEGHVALVTGAGSGIGQATALAYAHAGANVVVVDHHPDGTKETAEAVRDAGVEALMAVCDVRHLEDVARVARETKETFGTLQHAFNNAGIEGPQGSTVETTEAGWDAVIDTNLKGVWACMKHEIPLLLESGGGTIVNCASVAGLVGIAQASAYVASKHGVVGLTKSAALEFAAQNIRINAVCPGVIRTPMIDRYTAGNAAAEEALVGLHPMARMGRPEEVADMVLWLSGDASSFVTGQALAIDGGWTTR